MHQGAAKIICTEHPPRRSPGLKSLNANIEAEGRSGQIYEGHAHTVHSEIFSQTLFYFKKSISGAIELKFSGKTLYAIL